MKTVFALFVFLTAVRVALASQVLLSVQDSEARPVVQAEARIFFLLPREQPPVRTVSDNAGNISAKGESLFGYVINVEKSGYYPASWRIEPNVERLEKTIILPAKRNPIPLFAREVGRASNADGFFPLENEWLGYDFEAGDWVAPHGKGKTTDIRFRYRHEFRGYNFSAEQLQEEIRISKELAERDRVEWTEEKFKVRYGKWSGEMEISFPGEKEGLIEVVEQFLPYSQLKMPYDAPVDGYGTGWKYALNNYSPTGLRDNVGFFLRTRVRQDEHGNIISAHYSKVIEDFRFGPQGRLLFTYYFNPTPNDRNLEFDPQRNLFPKSPQTEYIRDP